MGRFSGGCASRRESRSEINVRTLALAIVAITNSPCHQDRDSFATISRIDIMGSGTRGQTCLQRRGCTNRSQNFLANIALMERCGPLAVRCALSAKSVVPELILFGRRVPVDSHGAGSGRNWADPVTRHRNAGCCSERVAHFLRRLHDPLWLCREHYVFARISSKCRCAKCEREHDTRASNRRTAQATKPVFYSHAVIVIPFRILGKLI